MKQIDRDALREWNEIVKSIANETPIDTTLSPADIAKHRAELEKAPLAWITFFFLKYASAPFADFQKAAIHRIISQPEWYEVLSWARELAKSTIVMFVVMYLALTGKKQTIVLASSTVEAAQKLLAPYRANLEGNQRIKQYYGEQMSVGEWKEGLFRTKSGALFAACGAGQSPRGFRNENVRPDTILVDDFDTDEDCRNGEIINKKWEWFEDALYYSRSISNPLTVIFCGNLIAEDCCVTRAGRIADHWDIINTRMVDIKKPDSFNDYKYGKSVWPQKNSEADIDRAISKTSMSAALKEMFNSPIVEGKIFPSLKWGKIPPLSKFRFLVIYGDPTQSEAKGIAKNKKGSRKAQWLVGRIDQSYYVIKGFIFKGTNQRFIDNYFVLHNYAGGGRKVPIYVCQENNSLQDPFFMQVFKPLLAQARERWNSDLSITPDEEKKTDKAVRIEANLEPLNSQGRLIFNIDEKDDENMKDLAREAQFFNLGLTFPADGLDCIEGAKRIIDHKEEQLAPSTIIARSAMRRFNNKRI